MRAAAEAARFDAGRFAGYEWGVSAVSPEELRLGVLPAKDPEAASRRLSPYLFAQRFEALTVDEAVSEAPGHRWRQLQLIPAGAVTAASAAEVGWSPDR